MCICSRIEGKRASQTDCHKPISIFPTDANPSHHHCLPPSLHPIITPSHYHYLSPSKRVRPINASDRTPIAAEIRLMAEQRWRLNNTWGPTTRATEQRERPNNASGPTTPVAEKKTLAAEKRERPKHETGRLHRFSHTSRLIPGTHFKYFGDRTFH